MKKIRLYLLATCIAVIPPGCSHDNAAGAAADIVFVGPNIVTMDESLPNAEAVAVRGGEIVAVGSREDVMAMRGDATRMVELDDRALVPGFIDAHGHLAFAARLIDFVNLSSPPVGTVENIGEIVELLARRLAGSPPAAGEWLMGFGYDDSLVAEKRHPTRDDLDRVSTEHPIALLHVSGHLAAVNSAALEAVGVDSGTEDPNGGVIRRRPGSREPNGVLEETAIYPFTMARLSNVDPLELERLFRQAADDYASFGITTAQDGASSLADIAVFRESAARDAYPIDIVAYPMGNRLDDATLDSIAATGDYDGGFRVGGIKFSLDGSPQGRTAYLSEPYTEGPPGADEDYRAYPTYPSEKFNPRIERLIRAGTPVIAHANGDAAIDMLIDGVAAALDGIDMPDHRTVIIHAQLTREDQLPKIRDLGLVPSFYAAHPFFWGDWHRRSFGDERAVFISPSARAAELGIPFTVHNDTPIVPPDMMRLMWVAVNRKTRSGVVLGPEQRISPYQALHAITLGAAYQYFEEEKKGSITAGKRADLVILGANPLTVGPDDIQHIPIIETFARGRSVFRRP